MLTTIRLPSGRRIGAGQLAKAWRALRDGKISGSHYWDGFGWTPAAEILEQLRAGMLDRIERHDRTRRGWRKYDDAKYLRDLEHDRRLVDAYRYSRIRNTGCRGILLSEYFRARYPHINNQEVTP